MPIPDALLMRLPSPQNAFLGLRVSRVEHRVPPQVSHVIFLPVFMTGLLLGDLVIDFCLYVRFWNW